MRKENNTAMSIKPLTAKFYIRLTDQRGQGLIEYVLLVSVIAVALIGSLVSLQEVIYNTLMSIPMLSS